jgi:hypothetical protein
MFIMGDCRMGQQHKKVRKRNRRKRYLERQKERIKADMQNKRR